MKQWWSGLQPRERQTLLLGALALLLLLVYQFVWTPYTDAVTRLEQQVAGERTDLAWMRGAAAEVARLRATAPRRPGGGQSLLTRVDGAARAAGLGNALKRVQPDGNGGVRVWLKQAPFDRVVAWLDRLGRAEGVTVSELSVERKATAGRVDVRVSLGLGGS